MTALAAGAARRRARTTTCRPDLEASEPPEARGLTRDAVRMLVAAAARRRRSSTAPSPCCPAFLDPGDVVVINTSGTIPAAVDARAADGTELVVHLSTHLDGDRWVVEPRRRRRAVHAAVVGPAARSARSPWPTARRLTLEEPYGDAGRLWVATLSHRRGAP